MEFILFILFIFFLSLFGKKDSNKRNRNRNRNTNNLKDLIKDFQSLELDENNNWDSQGYHKKTKAHFPEQEYNERGWSRTKVYIPERNTEEYIDKETGDKYNKKGLDYFGNKKPEIKKKTPRKSFQTQKRTINQPTSKVQSEEYDKKLKPMWKSINPFLDYAKVEKFYHFTDKRNLESIIENGGLYTWNGLKNKNINGYISSNLTSQNLDKRKGLENYVRLSFSDYHPMSTVVRTQNNVELIWLEIDRNVASFEDTLFSNMNATDNNVSISGEFDFLKKLNFNIFKERYTSLDDFEKKQYQSEILIKDFLPLKYITNLEELKERYL